LVNVFLELRNKGNDAVTDGRVQNTDSALSKEEDEGANSISNEERGSVFKGKDKGLHSGCAEVLASERNLDISVLIDELDEAMEAVEAASSAINDAFGQRILVLDFFHL
jgi:hypothetical protein